MDIDKIIDLIIEGKSYRTIAQELDVKLTTFHDFISKPDHSARVRDAMQTSGDTFADMAEEVLKNATGTKEEIMRARELAQHYRWKAAKRYPKRYSDKMDIVSNGNAILPPWMHVNGDQPKS